MNTLEQAQQFIENAVPVIIKALVIVAVTALFAYVLRRILRKALSRDGSLLPSSSIFTNIANVGVWACGLSIMLSTCFSFDLSAAITALGVGGIAISLGCQDTISNLVGGLQVSLAGIVSPGDFIEVGAYRGVVTDVNWRYTHITTISGDAIVVPNAMINSQVLVHLPPQTCVKVPLRIMNTSRDLNAVSRAILTAVQENVHGIVCDKERNTPRLLFTDTSDYAFGATLTFHLKENVSYATARDEALRASAPYLVPEDADVAV